jgi:hypothetical protein
MGAVTLVDPVTPAVLAGPEESMGAVTLVDPVTPAVIAGPERPLAVPPERLPEDPLEEPEEVGGPVGGFTVGKVELNPSFTKPFIFKS